jgi:hypothetical protein
MYSGVNLALSTDCSTDWQKNVDFTMAELEDRGTYAKMPKGGGMFSIGYDFLAGSKIVVNMFVGGEHCQRVTFDVTK